MLKETCAELYIARKASVEQYAVIWVNGDKAAQLGCLKMLSEAAFIVSPSMLKPSLPYEDS